MKKHLLVVVGPTAVGKTACCLQLAKHFGTEIINADSRQVYRHLSVGTAKPTPAETSVVKHHLIDFLEPDQLYSAGQFETDALALLQQMYQHHNVALLSGGSGLYIKAVCEGMDEVPRNLEVRQQLMTELQDKGLLGLLTELQTADPAYYHSADRQNPHRIIRALEVIRLTGKPFSSFHQKEPKPRFFSSIKIGLQRPREELYERINLRMDLMLQNGLIEEAKTWFPLQHYNALQTVGYQELFGHWQGKYDFNEAVRLLKRNSRRYAKRQITWFGADPETTWFHPDDLEGMIKFVEEKICS